MDRKHHWNQVYETKGADDISWFQARPEMSLRLIAATGVAKADAILDVGAGTSLLVDHLLDEGYRDLTVLDISGAALKQAQARLGRRADLVRWVEADISPRRLMTWASWWRASAGRPPFRRIGRRHPASGGRG